MHRCSDMIVSCHWQGTPHKCSELFDVRRTDDGFCCSFNTMAVDEQL